MKKPKGHSGRVELKFLEIASLSGHWCVCRALLQLKSSFCSVQWWVFEIFWINIPQSQDAFVHFPVHFLEYLASHAGFITFRKNLHLFKKWKPWGIVKQIAFQIPWNALFKNENKCTKQIYKEVLVPSCLWSVPEGSQPRDMIGSNSLEDSEYSIPNSPLAQIYQTTQTTLKGTGAAVGFFFSLRKRTSFCEEHFTGQFSSDCCHFCSLAEDCQSTIVVAFLCHILSLQASAWKQALLHENYQSNNHQRTPSKIAQHLIRQHYTSLPQERFDNYSQICSFIWDYETENMGQEIFALLPDTILRFHSNIFDLQLHCSQTYNTGSVHTPGQSALLMRSYWSGVPSLIKRKCSLYLQIEEFTAATWCTSKSSSGSFLLFCLSVDFPIE